MKRVVVVIPVHKSNPTPNELASLKQCYKILGKHPIRILAPVGLDMSAYMDPVSNPEILSIDPVWLSSIEQYNKLKINLFFYNLFKEFEYLLTYELDAWVFRDELLYWCDKGYDYIGAPWFEGWHEAESDILTGIGNSGFSLRKVSSCLRILRKVDILERLRKFWYNSNLQSVVRIKNLRRVFGKFYKVKSYESVVSLSNGGWHVHEDFNWCQIIPYTFSDFHLAPVKQGIRFSFDVSPTRLYKMNGYRLPFGCHAWERYEPEFWQQFIKLSAN